MVRSEKGNDFGSMGEWTAVASAKRGVLGGFARDEDVDDVDVDETEPPDLVRDGARLRASGRFLSS